MKSQVVCIVQIPYSFTDKSGKLCEGVTKKAAVINFNDDNTPRGLECVKISKALTLRLKH